MNNNARKLLHTSSWVVLGDYYDRKYWARLNYECLLPVVGQMFWRLSKEEQDFILRSMPKPQSVCTFCDHCKKKSKEDTGGSLLE